MGTVGAAFWSIGRQPGGTGDTGRLVFHGPVTQRAAEGDDCHRPGRSGRAELVWPAAEPCRQRTFGVRHGGLQQVLGSARHFQQFGHCPAAAAEHENDLARSIVNLPDEFFRKNGHG